MNVFRKLWTDEAGVVMTAETVMLGTVAVLGLTVGIGTISSAVNGELNEMGMAFRSFDQSFSVPGFRTTVSRSASGGGCLGGGASLLRSSGGVVAGGGSGVISMTAGSSYIQPPVAESQAALQLQFNDSDAARCEMTGRVLQRLDTAQLQELDRLRSLNGEGVCDGTL